MEDLWELEHTYDGNFHSIQNDFSLQIWAQDVCQEDCPLGSLLMGGLASLLYLVFIDRFLTASVPVEICFYKSAFFHWAEKNVAKMSDYL